MDWNAIWNSIKTFFTSNFWNIIEFIAVLFFGVIIIKILLNLTKRLLNKTRMEKIGIQFAVGILKFISYLILSLILLSIIGIQISGIITAFSAILLAIGVALEDNIANFTNGIIIVSTHLFNKGDYIIIEDVEGSISDINFLFTTLITSDNKRITLPNNTIINSCVTNNGAYPQRRIQITFSVAFDSNVELVKKIVIDTMKSNGKVYLDKPIFCRLKTIGTNSLNFYSYCWVDKEDYWDVYYYIMEMVFNEFKRNNITIPLSQVEVRNKNNEVSMPIIGNSLPERIEKKREQKEVFDLETSDLTQVFKLKRIKKYSKKENNKSDN